MKRVLITISIASILILPIAVNLWGLKVNLEIENNRLKEEAQRRESIYTENLVLARQQKEFKDVIEKIVTSLASNDKQVGIGGAEIDTPGYTDREILIAISEEIKQRDPDEWFNNVKIFFDARSNYFDDVPEIWPISREHFGRITSGFGIRKSPLDGKIREHNGVDISADIGTPVLATADGVVVGSWERHPVFGKIVYIKHNNGFQTRYGHLDSISVGYLDEVKKGQQVGTVGDSGVSFGAHLHYEIIKNNSPMDPVKFWLLYY